MKIIAIGDNVADCYLDQMKFYPGGNCVNVAVGCKRNGAGQVAYLGILATDDKAEAIRAVIEKEGVDTHLCRVVEGISGQPRVNLVDGDRVFIGGPKNTVQHKVKLKLIEEDFHFASLFDLAHVSCYSNMEEELSGLAESVDISFDFSDMHSDEYLVKVCPHIRFAFFSGSHMEKEEINVLAQKVCEFGVEVIGITRGAEGAVFYKNGEMFHRSPDPTDVIDTMGAGDSFIAGFLTCYIDTGNMEEALDAAAASSAKTCTFNGGIGYPHNLHDTMV